MTGHRSNLFSLSISLIGLVPYAFLVALSFLLAWIMTRWTGGHLKWVNFKSKFLWILGIVASAELTPKILAKTTPTLVTYADPLFFWALVFMIVAITMTHRAVTQGKLLFSFVVSTVIVLVRFYTLAGTLGSKLFVTVGFDGKVYYSASEYQLDGDFSGTTDYRRLLVFFELVERSSCKVDHAVYGPRIFDGASGSIEAGHCRISR